MSKGKKAILMAFVFLILFFCSFTFWKELEPDFSAIDYLKSRGYSSVRILRQLAKGHGCKPEDTYRFVVDRFPLKAQAEWKARSAEEAQPFGTKRNDLALAEYF